MPDPDLLPPGRSVRPAAPAAAGLEGVLSGATSRRRRRAAVLGGVSAACVVATVVVLGGGSGVQSLQETPAAPSSASASPAPSTRGGIALPSGLPNVYVTTVPSPSASPEASGSPQPDATKSPEAPAPPSATASPATAGTEVGPARTTSSYDTARTCDGDGPTVAQGWCSYYDGVTTGAGGTRVELAASICRMPGRGPGTLRASSGQEAEFSVFADGDERWTWSKGHAFRSTGSQFTVVEGACARWHVAWDVVDDSGRALAPGTYDLFARPWVSSPGASITNNTNSLTFTVT